MGATSVHGRLAISLARILGAKRVVGCARHRSALRALNLDAYAVLQYRTEFTDFGRLGHVDVILDYDYEFATTHLLGSLIQRGRVQYMKVNGYTTGAQINLPGSILDQIDLTIRGRGTYGVSTIVRELPGVLRAIMSIDSETILVKRLRDIGTAWYIDADWLVFVP